MLSEIEASGRSAKPEPWKPVDIRRAQGAVVVALYGALDETSTSWLDPLLGDLVEGQGNQYVAVDLTNVRAIDPPVMRLLAGVFARASARGGRFTLRDPAPAIVTDLRRVGLAGALEHTEQRPA